MEDINVLLKQTTKKILYLILYTNPVLKAFIVICFYVTEENGQLMFGAKVFMYIYCLMKMFRLQVIFRCNTVKHKHMQICLPQMKMFCLLWDVSDIEHLL